MSDLYIQGRLERQAAHGTIVAMLAVLEDLCDPCVIEDTILDPGVLIGPLLRSQKRVRLADGTPMVVDTTSGAVLRAFPAGWTVRSQTAVCHIVDRGSPGAAGLHFCVGCMRFLYSIAWGVFHDSWNAVKAAAKRAGGGSIWCEVLKFASIGNFNFGPFRSGVWGTEKLQKLTLLTSLHDASWDEFRTAAEAQAELDGDGARAAAGTVDYDGYWTFFCSLPSCVRSGPVVKFARWGSVSDVWSWYRGELFFLRLIHAALAPVGSVDDDEHQDLTEEWDAGVSERITGSKKGLKRRIPAYIRWELATALDVFTLSTHQFHMRYKLAAKYVKNSRDAQRQNTRLAGGCWKRVYLAQVRHALNEPGTCKHLTGPAVPENRRSAGTGLLYEMTVHNLAEQALRDLPRFEQYPGCSARALVDDDDDRRAALQDLVEDWHILQAAEAEAARNNQDSVQLLKSVTWAQQALIRLTFLVAEDELARGIPPRGTMHLLEGQHRHLGDEKAPEDCHGLIRDKARCNRSRRVSCALAYETIQNSGVIENRRQQTISVRAQDVALRSWATWSKKRKLGDPFPRRPRNVPPGLKEILTPGRSWPSPTVVSQAASAVAWQWMRSRWLTQDRNLGALAPWWSRLAKRMDVLMNEAEMAVCLVLFSCGLGFFAAHLSPLNLPGEELWQLPGNDTQDFGIVHVLDPLAWKCAKATPIALPEGGVALSLGKADEHLLRRALSRRRTFTTWELRRALMQVEEPKPAENDLQDLSILQLVARLIAIVFAGEDAGLMRELVEAYERPPEDEDESMVGHQEVDGLLDELIVNDQANATDLKAFRAELSAKSRKGLDQKRAREQREQREQRAARAKAKKARRKRKKRAANGRRLLGRGKPKAPEPAAPTGAPPAQLAADAPRAAARPVVSGSSSDPPAVPGRLPEDNEVQQPRATKHWKVHRVDGGWLRWSETKSRCDAHCCYHKGCKMDRVLTKGPVGLSCAWLAGGAGIDRASHVVLKETLSGADGFPTRNTARERVIAMALTDEVKQEILDVEARARSGDRSEPDVIACPSVFAELAFALAQASGANREAPAMNPAR